MGANQEIIAELRRVLNERDEAREQLYLTKAELGRWVDRETKAARERDEARAEVERLQYDFTNRDRMWAEECLRGVSLERRLQEARAEVEKLSESAKAAWEAECVMREQRDRYHAELKQERQEVERLRTALLEVQTSESAPAWFADGFHDGWKAGAEAMRLACQQWCRAWENNGDAIADALADLRVEDKP